MNDALELSENGHTVRIVAKKPGGKGHNKLGVSNLREEMACLEMPHELPQRLLNSYKPLFGLIRSPKTLFETLKFWKYGKESLSLKLLYFANAVQNSDFDVLHAHFGPNGNIAVTARQAGIIDCPVVTSFYGVDASKTLHTKPDYFKKTFEGSDLVLALTDNMADDLAENGCPEDKIETIYMGVPLDDFEFIPRSREPGDPYRILTIARFVEKKGITYGLEAIAELKDEYPIQYDIIGDGPLRSKIEQKIKDLGLEDTVTLHGYVDYSELPERMQKSHILLAPSVTAEDGNKEGAPMVLLEAQATSMPVVSTKHAGIPEIVAYKEHLAPEKDSNGLADILSQLFDEVNTWEDVGEKGRQFIENQHSMEKRAERLEAIYRRLTK